MLFVAFLLLFRVLFACLGFVFVFCCCCCLFVVVELLLCCCCCCCFWGVGEVVEAILGTRFLSEKEALCKNLILNCLV